MSLLLQNSSIASRKTASFLAERILGKLILNSSDCFQENTIPILCLIRSYDLSGIEDEEFDFEGADVLEVEVNLIPY